MADTIITASDHLQIISTDGTTTDTIQFGGSAIERLSDNKNVLFEGDAEPPLGFTPEDQANKTTVLTNSTTDYPSGAAVTDALALKLDSTKQSVNTTVSGLRAITSPQADVLYQTMDFGGGNWYWNATDISSDNTATVIKVTTIATGRFNRIYPGNVVYASWFGAIADGSTDCYDALQNAINYLAGNGTMRLDNGTYYLNKSLAGGLSLPANASGLIIEGQGDNTVIKLSRNVPRFLDFLGSGTIATTLFENITIRNLQVDANNIDGPTMAPPVTVASTVTNSTAGTLTMDINVGSNTGFLASGIVYFALLNTGVRNVQRTYNVKSGSTSIIQVTIRPGETVYAGDIIIGCSQGSIIGTATNAANSQYALNINFDNLIFENLTFKNIPTAHIDYDPILANRDATFRYGLFIVSEPGFGYTGTLYQTNITVLNVKIYGGAVGFYIGQTNNSIPNRLWVGNLLLRDCYHDTLLTPVNQATQLNYVLVGAGFGDNILVENCIGKNSADVGLEADGAKNIIINDCQMFNAQGSGYFIHNYSSPATTITGPLITTISNGGTTISTTATSIPCTAVPLDSLNEGYIMIDTELIYYTRTNGSNTITVIRSKNGVVATHVDGSKIIFIESNQAIFNNCYYLNDSLSGTNIGRSFGWYQNGYSTFPGADVVLNNCNYIRVGVDIISQGEAFRAIGTNSNITLDKFNVVVKGINHTTTEGNSGSAIYVDNSTYLSTDTIPAQKLTLNNIYMNINGVTDNGTANSTTYDSISLGKGNFILALSNIKIENNLYTVGASKIRGINFNGGAPNKVNGSIKDYSLRAPNSTTPVGIKNGTTTITNLYVENLDYPNLDYSNLGLPGATSGLSLTTYASGAIPFANFSKVWVTDVNKLYINPSNGFMSLGSGTFNAYPLNIISVGTLGSAYALGITDGSRMMKIGVGTGYGEIQTAGGAALYLNYAGNNVFISAQGTGGTVIGAASVPTNALFAVVSTVKGAIPAPAMTTTQQNAIATPAEGMQIYDTTLHTPAFFNGTSWTSYVLNSGNQTIAGIKTFIAQLNISGSSSGTVSLTTQAAAGTYNFNLPTTAGTAGQVLTSQGGGSSAMTWTNLNPSTIDITNSTPVNLAVGNKYYANNAALSTGILPTTIAKGEQIIMRGQGTGGWKITQNSGQTIHGATSTTTGTTGYIQSQAQYDTVTLECIVANTEFVIVSVTGALLIV